MSNSSNSELASMIVELPSEKRVSRNQFLFEAFERPQEIPLPKLPKKEVKDSPPSFATWTAALVFGMAIGIFITCGAFFLMGFSQPTVVTVEKASIDTQLVVGEMALIKKILTGLVGAVQTLEDRNSQKVNVEEQKQVPHENKSSTLRVIADSAHLRNLPDRAAQSLATVPKDTLLLSENSQDGWYQVTTPIGEIAWISSEVISVIGAS